MEVACALKMIMKHIIVWPAGDQINEIAENFFRKTGFPGIGAIDGTCIQIPGTKKNRDLCKQENVNKYSVASSL